VLDARGVWDDSNSKVTEWRHVATMGRDHYAGVVTRGFLFPFGHRASLVKITERIFHPSLPGNPGYLRQRVFVLVRQQDKFYLRNAPSVTAPSGARFDLQMPFQRVRVTTTVTPNLDPPEQHPAPRPSDTLSCFCPRVGGADFRFHLVAEDLDGNEIEFSAPLYFLDTSQFGDVAPAKMPDHLDDVIINYQNSRGICDFQGQRVPFAEGSDSNKPSDIKPGSTSFETASVVFSATRLDDTHVSALAHAIPTLDGLSSWECHFYPSVVAANIIVPALKHLAGNAGPVRVNYDYPVYLQHGFDGPNKGQVFLRMADPSDPGGKISFSQQADRSGGLATPNMQMTALSRLLGPVAGDAAKLSGGNFDPKDFFAALEKTLDKALLFGTIPLTEVLSPVGLDDPRNLPQLPRFVTEALTKLDGLIQDAAAAQDLINKVSQEAANLGPQAGLISADAAAVAKGLGALTTDLQGLANDPKSAAQGFYQEGPDPGLLNRVKAPSDPSGNQWNSPAVTASQECGGCHDSGPVIRSPYITQLVVANKLPGADDACSTAECRTFNDDPQKYAFVGPDFASWKAFEVKISGNRCNECHRMGVNNVSPNGSEGGRYMQEHGVAGPTVSRILIILATAAFPLLGTVVGLSARAETIKEYAAECDTAMGNPSYTVPEFLCDDPRSSELPMTNPRDRGGNPLNITGKSVQQIYETMRARAAQPAQPNRPPLDPLPPMSCDRPNRLNKECDPGSRFRVLLNRWSDVSHHSSVKRLT
jgi:hypothetical protein